jgi:hypothetical protein
MGLRPNQADEKRLLFSNYSSGRATPPPCHPDRSATGFPTLRCWRRPRVRLSVSTGNPGERSGGTCGSAVSSWATPVQQLQSLEAPPFPLSSRPELRRSVVERSAVPRSFPGYVFRQSVSWVAVLALSCTWIVVIVQLQATTRGRIGPDDLY